MGFKRKKMMRRPSHPGEVLKELWLSDMNLSQQKFAEMIVKASENTAKLSTVKTKLSEVLNQKRDLSADFALLIAKATNTEPEMWLNLQRNLELWEARQRFQNKLMETHPESYHSYI